MSTGDLWSLVCGRNHEKHVCCTRQLCSSSCTAVTHRVPAGDLPSLQELGFDSATLQRCAKDTSAAGAGLRGGESEAMRRLQDFITHFTRPGSAITAGSSGSGSSGIGSSGTKSGAGPNFCCKISPWLALGCLSPRQLYEQLQQRLSGQPQQLRAAGQGTDTGEGIMGL